VLDLKISGTIAGTAFLLSFLIGLINKLSVLQLIIRPLIFAVVFFILSILVKYLIDRFLPELVDISNDISNDTSGESSAPGVIPGSMVNIMEGGEADYPMEAPLSFQGPLGARPDDSGDDVGHISDLFKIQPPDEKFMAGMDQNGEDGYTGKGMEDRGAEKDRRAGAERREASRNPAGFSDSDETLPDLDSMAGAFVSSSSDEDQETIDYSISAPARKRSPDKAQAWAGDFKPKEIAAGIRTVLTKEKEG
jgi:hypothetical protein